MKRFWCLVVYLLSGMGACAQAVIENPDYGFSTAGGLRIEKVEVSDSATVVSLRFMGRVGSTFSIPEKTYIQPNGHDEQLYVVKSVNAPLRKRIKITDPGGYAYRLEFPPIDPRTALLDFGEGNKGGSWFIYDIQLNASDTDSAYPRALNGNWFDCSDSDWVAGFYSGKVIWNKRLWDCVDFDGSNEKGTLRLKIGSDEKSLSIAHGKDGNYVFREKDGEPIICSPNRKKGVHTEDAYKLPVFHNNPATYSGYLKGFNEATALKLGKKTGTVSVDNLLTGDQDTYAIRLDKNGAFSVTLPLYYPHRVWVNLPGFYGRIFLEPGKELFHLVGTGNTAPQFMGEPAAVNYDLRKLRDLENFDDDTMYQQILEMDPPAYKTYCINLMNRELATLEERYDTGNVGEKAYQIKRMDIIYRHMSEAICYTDNYKIAYCDHNKIKRNLCSLDIEVEQPDGDYYDFLTSELVNNPLAVISTEYDDFLNQLKFMPELHAKGDVSDHDALIHLSSTGCGFSEADMTVISVLKEIQKLEEAAAQSAFYQKYGWRLYELYKKYEKPLKETGDTFNYSTLRDSLAKTGHSLLPEEEELLDAVIVQSQNPFIQQRRELFTENAKAIHSLVSRKADEIEKTMETWSVEQRNRNLAEKFGIKKGLASDIMLSNDLCREIVDQMTPLPEEKLSMYTKRFVTPFVADYVAEKNQETLTEIKTRTGSGSTASQVPKTEGAELFSAIMEKYKGKVILVDFWATTCGPCISGIKRVTPLKEELKGQDIAFVYITGPRSPEGTYNNMIPSIDGEHYRVSADEWNYLMEEFKISGIPHYALVGKGGEIINSHFRLGGNDHLREVLLEHVQQP